MPTRGPSPPCESWASPTSATRASSTPHSRRAAAWQGCAGGAARTAQPPRPAAAASRRGQPPRPAAAAAAHLQPPACLLQVLLACPPLQQALAGSGGQGRGPLGFALQQAYAHVNGEQGWRPPCLRAEPRAAWLPGSTQRGRWQPAHPLPQPDAPLARCPRRAPDAAQPALQPAGAARGGVQDRAPVQGQTAAGQPRAAAIPDGWWALGLPAPGAEAGDSAA
jgi:hypothetical protein